MDLTPPLKADEARSRSPLVIGLLTSVGRTLDAFFVEIAGRWSDLGATVQVAAGSRPDGFADPTVLPSMTRKPSPKNWRALGELRAWVREKEIDVVITNTATASTLIRMAGVGVPVIYFCHGLHWHGKRLADAPYRVAESLLLARTRGIVCINSDDEEWFSRRAPGVPKLRLVNGVGLDTVRFNRRESIPWHEGHEPLRLVWCGEFSERKNPAAAIEVVRTLRRWGVDVVLDMLGQGALFDTLIIPEAIGDRVRRHGSTDVIPFFSTAHVLFQTARWEGLPRVGLEAVAMGLPVVGFDVKGVRDLPSVSVAPEHDIDALAGAVLQAARDTGRDLPNASALSYTHAADSLHEFATSVVTGDFSRGLSYSV